MNGRIFPSEKREFTDACTGLTITQLTQTGINYHLYFTDNAFDIGNQSVYMLSNRANEGEVFNIFRLDIDTGIMTQMTNEPDGIGPLDSYTKTPDSEYIAYLVDHRFLKVLNTRTGETRTLYEEKDMALQSISISSDKKKIGFIRNEQTWVGTGSGPNYLGFRDKMFAIKDARISVINMDGTGFRDVFRDTTWLGHFQFSPVDSRYAMFCHEGPWNEVLQRIWIVDLETGSVWPCFRQGADDCVGHEFWLRNGDIVFDNRRGGHDGTISVTMEQCFAKESQVSDAPPYFGFADISGTVYRTVTMPYYCNHYIANENASLFAGDNVKDIVLIRPDGREGQPSICTLARHNTTWKYQRSHCHPTFSWDGRRILYAADSDDTHCNLFLVDVPLDLL